MFDVDYQKSVSKNVSFADLGYADGFADMPSEEGRIIDELYGIVTLSDLINYVDDYLRGYEVGNFYSEHFIEIYGEEDDDEENEEEWDIGSSSHREEAIEQVMKKCSSREEIAKLYLLKANNFYMLGYEDGYIEKEKNVQDILDKLYGVVSEEELVDYIFDYLKGYDVGYKEANHYLLYDEDDEIEGKINLSKPIEEINKDKVLEYIKKYQYKN